jgi:hypothetical protein
MIVLENEQLTCDECAELIRILADEVRGIHRSLP